MLQVWGAYIWRGLFSEFYGIIPIKYNCVSGKGTHFLGILGILSTHFVSTFSSSYVGPCWTFSFKAVYNIDTTSQI